MQSSSRHAVFVLFLLTLTLLTFSAVASAHDTVLPAGTILRCTLDEPNLSTNTVAVGDPILCHLHSQLEFGQQAFPRGSYLIGHLEAAKDPGHFWGKGFLKIQFDRIGLPQGDMALDAKVIGTRGYKVDKYGDIDGKGHAKRDVIEWMIPPLWPWKIIMLPARGPRPSLKGETQLTLRLMDDVEVPQVAHTFGPDWHFFGHPYNDPSYNPASYNDDAYNSSYRSPNNNAGPQLARRVSPSQGEPRLQEVTQVSYADYKPKSSAISYATPNIDANVALPVISAAGATPSVASGSGTVVSAKSAGAPVFVLKTGTVLAVGNYTYQDGRIRYELASGGSGVVSADEVDWTTTTQMNLQHGVRVLQPSAPARTISAGL